MIKVYPYKLGSKSAKQLSEGLGCRRVRSVGSYTPRRGDFIIGWGSSIIPAFFERVGRLNASGGNIKFLNPPDKVGNASNKLRTFRILKESGVSTPEWTESMAVAGDWDENGWRGSVYIRHKLTGHSGEGIQILNDDMALPPAPLYVKGIENHGEYRIHIVDGQVIAYTKKKRPRGSIPTEEQLRIRSHDNGWIYSTLGLRRLERIETLAVRAVDALELDFGAVDIIKDENGDVYVLEVNTSPGLAPATLDAYLTSFRNLIESHARTI